MAFLPSFLDMPRMASTAPGPPWSKPCPELPEAIKAGIVAMVKATL